MKAETSTLSGIALDWVVSVYQGYTPFSDGISLIVDVDGQYRQLPRYSTDWAQGGPILGAMMASGKVESFMYRGVCTVEYNNETGGCTANGPTPLVAGMRCYAISKMGEEVEIPDELL